jgi:hypothetical protein
VQQPRHSAGGRCYNAGELRHPLLSLLLLLLLLLLHLPSAPVMLCLLLLLMMMIDLLSHCPSCDDCTGLGSSGGMRCTLCADNAGGLQHC